MNDRHSAHILDAESESNNSESESRRMVVFAVQRFLVENDPILHKGLRAPCGALGENEEGCFCYSMPGLLYPQFNVND